MLVLFWASLDFPTFNKDCRKRRGNFVLVIPTQIRNYRRFVKEMNGAVCRIPSLDNVGGIGATHVEINSGFVEPGTDLLP